MKFDGLLLSKKYIPPAKILYAEDLSNIIFNYLFENLPNDLHHFWNHESFFTTQPLYFLAQTLHTFYQSSLSKWKVLRFATARIKIHKIAHVIFGTKSQFFFKLCITLQCHGTNSSVLFHLNLYMFWTKTSNESVNFQTSDCSDES